MKNCIYIILIFSLLSCSKEEPKLEVPEEKSYPLTINIIGEGEVEEEVIIPTKSNKDYIEGTVVKLTANNSKDWWSFSNWSGDVQSEDKSIEIVVNEPTEITATFNSSN